MTAANPAHATVTAALAQLDAWREMYTNGVAPTHKRQLLMDLLYTATGVENPQSRGHASYVHYGAKGVEIAVTEFDEKLRDPAFDWSSAASRRALIIGLADRCINDLREGTAPLTVFGIAFASYTPTWLDLNDDFIEDALQAPQLLTAPAITGTLEEGETLTVSTGEWTGPTPTYTYEWFLNGVLMEDETESTYDVLETVGDDPGPAVEGDADKTVQARVTATNENGSTQAFAAAVEIEADSR